MAVVMEAAEFDWRAFAACSDFTSIAPEDNPFFADGQGNTYPVARIYCSSCPVVIDCLIEGLEPDNTGMWGCMSPNERTTVNSVMDEGFSLKQAAEAVWDLQRKRQRGMTVPPKSIWKEWNA